MPARRGAISLRAFSFPKITHNNIKGTLNINLMCLLKPVLQFHGIRQCSGERPTFPGLDDPSIIGAGRLNLCPPRTFRFLSSQYRRRPTFPGLDDPSIIGDEMLNFRVRDGNGCSHLSKVTGILNSKVRGVRDACPPLAEEQASLRRAKATRTLPNTLLIHNSKCKINK